MGDGQWKEIAERARAIHSGVVDEDRADEILEMIAETDVDPDPAVAGQLLPTPAIGRMYRDHPEDADELLATVDAARRQFGPAETVAILGTAIQHSSAAPGDLSPEDIPTAIKSHQQRKESALGSSDSGRPSKIEALVERLQDGDLSDATESERAIAVCEFREEVATKTWLRFVDRVEDTEIDPERLAEDGDTLQRLEEQ